MIEHMRSIILVFLTLLAAGSAVAQTPDPQLLQLRRQLALYYLDPASHMALAKYFWQRDDRLQAFYNLEYARRNRFPEPQFNQAFHSAFGGGRGPTESKQAQDLFNKAAALQQAGETKQAEEYFVRAAELAPNSVYIQSWVGRFFFKVRHDG